MNSDRVSPYEFLDRPTDAPALVDGAAGRVWSQAELASEVRSLAERLRTGRRELCFCLCARDAASVIGYLACVHAGHAVALLDAGVNIKFTGALVERYRPVFVLEPSGAQAPRVRRGPADRRQRVDERLAVLLSTSGTTGSPKLVRLSRRNIDANAAAIAAYLAIDAGERAIQSLPIEYSYGLSVLNSHLAAGACVIVSPHSIMRPEFWADAARWGATSLAGVPYTYAVLERTGLLQKSMPDSMTTLTQAGGRLAPEAVRRLHELLWRRGARLWVMYGQTEATARISYVPPEALPEKADTIGVPIPGGELTILSGGTEVTAPGVAGELIYRGPNVMLGYAEDPDDLILGDQLNGRLYTGDMGEFDADGFVRLTGRRKRIAKVYGLRVNLDEVEAVAGADAPVAAVTGDEQILLWRAAGSEMAPDELRLKIARRLRLHSRALMVRDIDELPVTANGKVDYERLVRLGAG